MAEDCGGAEGDGGGTERTRGWGRPWSEKAEMGAAWEEGVKVNIAPPSHPACTDDCPGQDGCPSSRGDWSHGPVWGCSGVSRSPLPDRQAVSRRRFLQVHGAALSAGQHAWGPISRGWACGGRKSRVSSSKRFKGQEVCELQMSPSPTAFSSTHPGARPHCW